MPQGTLTAQAVAELVGGHLVGEGSISIRRVGPLNRAGDDTLSFLVSPKYLSYFRTSAAAVVLMPEALAGEAEGPRTRILVADPYHALVAVIPKLFVPDPPVPGIHPSASVGSGCMLGPDVCVGARVVIGQGVTLGARCRIEAGAVLEDGVVVGDDSVVGPNVVCHAGVRVGNRVLLKAGAVLGGPGFGFLSSGAGHKRIPHVGGCIIGDDVEIGSHSCVDRGTIDDTVIGRGTKIDNLVHVAHNVRVGERCLIAACSGIAGSSTVGNDVLIGGMVGIADHLVIGDRARLAGNSGVLGDVPAGATYGGSPAIPKLEWLRAEAALRRLSVLVKDLEALVKERNPRA